MVQSVRRRSHGFSYGNIVAICAENNKVNFYTERGYYVQATFDLEINDNCISESIDLNEEIYTHVCVPPYSRIRQCYMFRPDIMACITADKMLGISIKRESWKMYNVFPIIHGVPTAVLIYANLLILGLDSGNVHIFYVKDFDAIDFYNISSTKLTPDTTSVVFLNIMFHNELRLIISYHKKIYIVKFI